MMLTQEKQAFIGRIASRNAADDQGRAILWSRHAITELINEGWSRRMVEDALCQTLVIEDYPTLNRPLPDCLVLAWSEQGVPIHAVIAIDQENERLFVVTVYQPSPEEWNYDFQTRKK
jgi:hypothetical protein